MSLTRLQELCSIRESSHLKNEYTLSFDLHYSVKVKAMTMTVLCKTKRAGLPNSKLVNIAAAAVSGSCIVRIVEEKTGPFFVCLERGCVQWKKINITDIED